MAGAIAVRTQLEPAASKSGRTLGNAPVVPPPPAQGRYQAQFGTWLSLHAGGPRATAEPVRA